jgi:hypothetical protein
MLPAPYKIVPKKYSALLGRMDYLTQLHSKTQAPGPGTTHTQTQVTERVDGHGSCRFHARSREVLMYLEGNELLLQARSLVSDPYLLYCL